MSTDSIDRRVRKTRRQLRECLISLLKEKKSPGHHGPRADRHGRSEQGNLLPSL